MTEQLNILECTYPRFLFKSPAWLFHDFLNMCFFTHQTWQPDSSPRWVDLKMPFQLFVEPPVRQSMHVSFPTCQVRVLSFGVALRASFLLSSSSSSSSSLPPSQLLIAVGTAGPQPGTFRVQWAPLDLNRGLPEQCALRTSTGDFPSPVGTAGLNRQIECQIECQMECQIECQIECQNKCQI